MYWRQFFIIFYDTNKKSPNHSSEKWINSSRMLQTTSNKITKIGRRQFFIIFYDTNKKEF